ncbi:MAG: aspartyl protease family protein [Verrucomicrobiota bacterium]|nr:aspartyl protease family protein [Verrucomicrobiota bacterium]
MIARTPGSLSKRASLALLIFALAASSFATPPRPPANPRARKNSAPQVAPRLPQYQALPLERSAQNKLLLRTFINGKPALMEVDTGAPISAIAISRLGYFGLTPVAANSELPVRVDINGALSRVTLAQSFQIGVLTLVDEPLVALDLAQISDASRLADEQEIDGILGADVLFPTQAVLDCRAQTLTMKIDPRVPGAVPGRDYRGFSSVPIQVSAGNNLYVDGTFNGRRAKLMVDTGAFTTLFHQRFVRRMKIPMRLNRAMTAGGVNLRRRRLQLATISRFSVGSVDLRSTEVGVTDLAGLVGTELFNTSTPVAGLLGSEILRRHSGIIDFGTRTLYLKRTRDGS